VGCRTASRHANQAGARDNNQSYFGTSASCVAYKENAADEAELWQAQEGSRFQTSIEKQKNLCLACHKTLTA
jgi:hypothetical protein